MMSLFRGLAIMAEQTEQAARTDLSPLRAWIIRHPIATFLVLVYATTTALVFVPPGADRAGAASRRSDAARGARERPRLGCASLHRYRPGEWKIRGARSGSAQPSMAGAAALVSDWLARPTADLVDRYHHPVWPRPIARSRPELAAAAHRIPAGVGGHDFVEQCR